MLFEDLAGSLVELTRQEPPFILEHGHIAPASNQGACRLEAQYAPANAHTPDPSLSHFKDGPCVAERTQARDVLFARTSEGGDKGMCSGGKYEFVEGVLVSVCQCDKLLVQRNISHFCATQEPHILLLVPALRMDTQIVFGDFAGEISRQIQPVVRKLRLL